MQSKAEEKKGGRAYNGCPSGIRLPGYAHTHTLRWKSRGRPWVRLHMI